MARRKLDPQLSKLAQLEAAPMSEDTAAAAPQHSADQPGKWAQDLRE